jgi:hypothetical protein
VLVGWQGRWPSDDIDWKAAGLTKYYNLTGGWKHQVVYNYDLAANSRIVVLTEGCTDVWAIGWRAIAVLGSDIHQRHIDLFQHTWRNSVIVVLLDNDEPEAQINAAELVEKLRHPMGQVGTRVLNACPPKGYDPGKLGTDLNWFIIRDCVEAAGLNLDQYMVAV